jgi:hypothetical protein
MDTYEMVKADVDDKIHNLTINMVNKYHISREVARDMVNHAIRELFGMFNPKSIVVNEEEFVDFDLTESERELIIQAFGIINKAKQIRQECLKKKYAVNGKTTESDYQKYRREASEYKG